MCVLCRHLLSASPTSSYFFRLVISLKPSEQQSSVLVALFCFSRSYSLVSFLRCAIWLTMNFVFSRICACEQDGKKVLMVIYTAIRTIYKFSALFRIILFICFDRMLYLPLSSSSSFGVCFFFDLLWPIVFFPLFQFARCDGWGFINLVPYPYEITQIQHAYTLC